MKKYLSLFLCLVCLMLMTGCSNTCRDLAYDTDIVIENLVEAKDNFLIVLQKQRTIYSVHLRTFLMALIDDNHK